MFNVEKVMSDLTGICMQVGSKLLLAIIIFIVGRIVIGHIMKLVKKLHMELPETLTDVLKCKNPRCITSVEQEITHIFKLSDRNKRIYRCAYCDSRAK